MSVQFETVKENIPKGIKVLNRSSQENLVSFTLEKRGLAAVIGMLSIPLFLFGLLSCGGAANMSYESGALDGGPAMMFGMFSGFLSVGLCIYFISRFFMEKVSIKVTPEFIEINEKKYNPKLFGGFISGEQSSVWLNNHNTGTLVENTITGFAWVYGGEAISLKGGFTRVDPSDIIRFLNRLVTEIHPTVQTH